MKVNGTAVLHAEPAAVFAALNDPAVLARTIPGCESLQPIDTDRYRMTVTAGVASIKGSYDGQVALTDQDAPHAFTLRATGAGAPGTVDATVRVTLADGSDPSGGSQGAGTTTLAYDADAAVGGMIGGVGQRMLAGVAKKMAALFFANVDAVLTGAEPSPGVPATGAPAPAVPSPRAEPEASELLSPASAVGGGQPVRFPEGGTWRSSELDVPFWVVLAGVGAGAAWALAGVAVGAWVSRARRSR